MHWFIPKVMLTSRVTQVNKDILGKNVDQKVMQLLLKLDRLNYGTCFDQSEMC